MSRIKAGDFNVEFKVMKSSVNINDFGEAITTHSLERLVWGIKNVSSLRNINEKFEGDKLQSYGEFYIVLRYDSTWVEELNADWILEENFTGLKYEVLSFIIDPRKEYIELRTKIDIETIA